MTKVPGIKFIKDAKKRNRYITIDLKIHGEALRPILEQIGAVEESEFQKHFKDGYTSAEVKEYVMDAVDRKISKHDSI